MSLLSSIIKQNGPLNKLYFACLNGTMRPSMFVHEFHFSLLEIEIFLSCGLNFDGYLIVCVDFDIFVMNYGFDSKHSLGFVMFALLTIVNATHVSEAANLFGLFGFISST